MKQLRLKSFGVFVCCITLFAILAFAERQTDSQTISSSGTSTAKIGNTSGSVTASFEEIISGTPATVSIVIKGCKASGTCDTLETNTTTTAAQIRTPTISKVYDYFTITPSWTGGTNVTVQINTTLTTAVNGSGSGGGGGTPGGVDTDIQYNNAGAFGGITDGSSTQVLHGGRTFGSVVNGDIGSGAVTDDKASLAVKPAVTVVASSNTALSGTLTIDGVVTADGSLVLATAQSTGSQNGPWVVHSGAWTRPTWYPAGGTTQGIQFSTTFVRLGTTYQGTTWRMTTAAPITIDTTSTTWAQTPMVIDANSVANGVSGTGAVLRQGSPSITTPTIASFANANHDHSNSAGGGNIPEASITSLVSDLALKAPLAGPTFTGTVGGITKSMVGLGNVDNTSDAGKPVSTAQQTALDLKANLISPSFTTPTLGVATATSVNKMAVTAPATSSTLAVADGKTLTASNTLTLAGTDSTTITFPGISGKPWAVISATVGNTDTVSCPNNTTANFATTYTIPANYLVANKLLRITMSFGLTTTATVPSFGFNLQIGGTNVFVSNQGAPSAAWVKAPMSIMFYIQGSAAAGGSAAVYTHPSVTATTNSASLPFHQAVGTAIQQPVNLATNGTLVIQPQLFCSANTAGNSMTLQQLIVESD